MDGKILANSLVSLKGTDLRMVYALLCRTNIGHLLSSKTKDIFSKEEQDHFTIHLEKEAIKLEAEADETLQVDLLLELTKLLKTRGTKYTVEKEIEDQCSAIVNEVYQKYQKQDKQFHSFVTNKSDSTKLQQMIEFQMRKIFNELDDSFKDFSIEDQTKFAVKVNEYIHSLPEEKQTKIKEKLGINDLTDEMVRKAIATSGTSIVFAIIVEVSGFAFYTTATTLLATFAGLFGITLPFGIYTGLTSTIAVAASPFFIIPLLLGGGVFLINYQNNSLKKKLLPIIIMQIALPYMSNGSSNLSFTNFIKEWEKRYKHYSDLCKELKETEIEQCAKTSDVNLINQEIKKSERMIQQEKENIRLEKENIQFSLKNSNLESLSISIPFALHKNEYKELSNKIINLKASKISRENENGFFAYIGKSVTNLVTTLDIADVEKKKNLLLKEMVEDILHSNSNFRKTEIENIKNKEKNIKDLTILKNGKVKDQDKLVGILAVLSQNNISVTQEIKKYEKENYGMADIKTI